MRHVGIPLLAALLSLSGIAQADDAVVCRPLVATQKKDIQVWTSTDLPDGTKHNLGPIVFHRTDDKNALSQSMTNSVGQALNGPVFRTVPTIWWDKAFDGEGKGLGDTGVSSQVIFQGDWNSFLQKNLENSESAGKEIDGRGILTMATQTLILGVSLLAGAPITSVANAGLTATYGSFTKEDTQWFKSIQLDPGTLKTPPKNVIVAKTCMNRRGQLMTCVQTLALIKGDDIERVKPIIAQNVAASLSQLVFPEPGLSPELEEKARHLNELLVAAKKTPSN